MAKKKRKPHKKPMRYPLSALDKFVYIAACAVFCILSVGNMLLFLLISRNLAFDDASVVACHQEGYMILYQVPLVIFFVGLLISTSILYNSKKPLFGNKSFVPRQGYWYDPEPPVFSLKFWRGMNEKTKSKIFLGTVICILVFAISVSVALLSIYPRTVLCKNDEIKTYNSFNEITETSDIRESDKLIIKIVLTGGKSKAYNIETTFVFGENEYDFLYTEFGNMETEEILEYMIRLKSDFEGKYEVRDTDCISLLCKDRNFTEAEKALVYKLFDYTE